MSAIGRIEGNRGIFVIPVGQTEIDGRRAAPFATLFAGSQWRWWGEALRIDRSGGPLYLEDSAARAALRLRAARSVARLLGDLGTAVQRNAGGGPEPEAAGFTVTDGRAAFRLGFAGGGSLLTVAGALPPWNADLSVIAVDGAPPDHSRLPGAAGGAVCFTPGTLLDTPEGPRPVEDIRPGDQVSTRDSGAQEVLWTGARHLSGARLFAMPHLRPVRIRAGTIGAGDAGLVVSPEHRLLICGPSARALFNEAEVLVEARDLLDDRTIRAETVPRDVTYIHLMTARHEIVRANGVETETFHPASADLHLAGPDERAALELVLGGAVYGAFARRCLSAPEAAIFRHDMA